METPLTKKMMLRTCSLETRVPIDAMRRSRSQNAVQ